MFSLLFNNYIEWAQSLGPEERLRVWGVAAILFVIYVIVDNIGREWMHDDPPPPPDDDLLY